MRTLSAIAVAVLSLVGCSGTGATTDGFLLREYAIDVPPARFEAGSVPLHIVNGGEFAHTMVVTGEDGRAIGATGTIAPGAAADLILDLAPGTYQVSCRIVVQLPDGRILDHYEAGMVASFAVADG